MRILINRIRAKWLGAEISDQEILKSLVIKYKDIPTFMMSIKTRHSSQFFISPEAKNEILATVRQICPQSVLLTIKTADEVCRHNFDLLGSGPVNLGNPIDWHIDFKTGHRFNPDQYYTDIKPAPYPGGYDIKIPWELSRCQHFTWLGQAYWFTGNEKYAQEFRTQVEDWIRQNPPQCGVNWVCTMDVAIRAVNWLWGYAYFQDSATLNDAFRLVFYKSMLIHGRHIMSNLEWSDSFTSNHYLTDVVGLVYLGILLPEFKEARRWKEFGLHELEQEMFKQVYHDGVDFEASTSYHRLDAELFLSTVLLAKNNGHSFTQEFMVRLEKMIDFINHMVKPDGTMPIIGDQDNGRLHRLKAWGDFDREWVDFRYLLAIGAILLNRQDLADDAGDQWEEALWFWGSKSMPLYQNSKLHNPDSIRSHSIGFPEGGIYLLKHDDLYMSVDLGTVGQNGRGGHAHNDTLSFELFAQGQTWIQDAGTFVYTSDYETRNLFRSTAYHNTVSMAGREQNQINAVEPFRMENETRPYLLCWQVEENLTFLVGEIQRIKSPIILHRRSILLDHHERVWIIHDNINGMTDVGCFYLHFAPGLVAEQAACMTIEQPYSGIKLINPDGKILWVLSLSPASVKIGIVQGWISNSYGKRETSFTAMFEWQGKDDHTMAILPQDESDVLVERIVNARKHMESLLCPKR